MEFEQIKQYISQILLDNDIVPSDEIFQKLDIYYDMLIQYNKNINLTAITEKNEVYIKHFADSLLGIKNYKYKSTVCDIGTGAGFPGIILKIARHDLKITLVDSLNKRVNFQQNVINALDLKEINALHYRVEEKEFKDKFLNSFDYVIARAVAPLNTLTEYCLPFVKVGGSFVAYKGQNAHQEIAEADSCIGTLGGNIDNIIQYKLLNNNERYLVIIGKSKSTSKLYPRDKNKPRNNPL